MVDQMSTKDLRTSTVASTMRMKRMKMARLSRTDYLSTSMASLGIPNCDTTHLQHRHRYRMAWSSTASSELTLRNRTKAPGLAPATI